LDSPIENPYSKDIARKIIPKIKKRLKLMRLVMSNTVAKTFSVSTLLNYLGACSNKFGIFTNLFKSHLDSLVTCQFTLEKSELFRIPSTCKELHILAGTAWITVAGRDIVLTCGEKASFEPNKDRAILSALGKTSVILEVLLG
jgi:hypothetical protein